MPNDRIKAVIDSLQHATMLILEFPEGRRREIALRCLREAAEQIAYSEDSNDAIKEDEFVP